MKKFTILKTLFIVFIVSLFNLSSLAQETWLNTNIQDWTKTTGTGYVNSDYTNAATGIVVENSSRVAAGAPSGITSMGTCSNDYIQMRNAQTGATPVAGGVIVLPAYTGVQKIEVGLVTGAASRPIKLYNGETLLTTFTAVKTGAKYTYEVPAADRGNTFNFILKEQTGAIYVCDIVVYKAVAVAVEAPEFTPATGTYYAPLNVTLASATDGATIYYTTDGTEPDNTSTVYTTPFPISATTTVKAIAYKDANASSVSTATYTLPAITEVATIAALRAGATDETIYKLTGEAVITFMSTTRNAKYIQDATGAILIDDNSGIITTAYNLYDGVKGFVGKIADYNGMLQFTPVTNSPAATSTENPVTPREVTLTDMANYPGQLVTVKGVSFNTTEETFAASKNYNLTDGTNTRVLRTQYADLNYIGEAIPESKLDVTGVILIHTSGAQLIARSIADFKEVVEPELNVAETEIPAMQVVSGQIATAEINITGKNLTKNVTLEITGADKTEFEIDTKLIAPQAGAITEKVTITYNPAEIGIHTAVLTISSEEFADDIEFTLSGKSTLAAPTALPAENPLYNAFTAKWDAVVGADKYELDVYTKNGDEKTTVDGYPLLVSDATSHTVTGLSASTKYFYTVKAIKTVESTDIPSLASEEIDVTTVAGPSIIVTEDNVPEMSAALGETTTAEIHVSGTALTGNITLIITPEGTPFTVDHATITPEDGTVAETKVTITYAPVTFPSHTATLTISADGVAPKEFELSGTATIPTPTVLAATEITSNSFTANWEEIQGVDKYELNVYTKGSGTKSETEGFGNVVPANGGKLIESATYLAGWSALSQSASRQIYTTEGNYGASSPSFALTVTDDFIETRTYPAPVTKFSFWAKAMGSSEDPVGTSNTIIQGFNGTEWDTIQIINNADATGGKVLALDLVELGYEDVVKIKMVFSKLVGNMGIDDITVEYVDSEITPVTDSPFTVTGATSKEITGLDAETDYYYTVTAIVVVDGSDVKSSVSEEMKVTTTPLLGLPEYASNLDLYTDKGYVYFTADGGLNVEIYNTLGQSIYNGKTTEGLNSIRVVEGVIIVKVGKLVNKVIIK